MTCTYSLAQLQACSDFDCEASLNDHFIESMKFEVIRSASKIPSLQLIQKISGLLKL